MVRVRIHREGAQGWVVEIVESDPLPRLLVPGHLYESWVAARDAATALAWPLG